MQNDIKKVETEFFRSLGNGVTAGVHLVELFRNCVNKRDTTVIVNAMDRAKSEKNDEQAARTIAFVASKIWPGAKKTTDKAGRTIIKISGISADMKAFERLEGTAKRKLSIRHTTFRKAIDGTNTKAKFDLQKTAESFAKRAKANGMSEAATVAAVKAAFKA